MVKFVNLQESQKHSISEVAWGGNLQVVRPINYNVPKPQTHKAENCCVISAATNLPPFRSNNTSPRKRRKTAASFSPQRIYRFFSSTTLPRKKAKNCCVIFAATNSASQQTPPLAEGEKLLRRFWSNENRLQIKGGLWMVQNNAGDVVYSNEYSKQFTLF